VKIDYRFSGQRSYKSGDVLLPVWFAVSQHQNRNSVEGA